MKYFVLETIVDENDSVGSLVTPKDTLNDARMLFHQIRASQLANKTLKYAFSCILDEKGGSWASEHHGSTKDPDNEEIEE